MLQYLLNATAIWFISLLCFDALLRRESYHSYNRFYLLITFITGLLLPLITWPGTRNVRYAAVRQPIDGIIAARQKIVAVQTGASGQLLHINWLLVVYALGALAAACILVAEIIKLVGYYHIGDKSTQGEWTIIETGKEHAPFSLMHLLFVPTRDCYTEAQWQMILTHESRHTRLWHMADLVLMQVARVLFWFHPLVYMYYNRLLLVHEYQADGATSTAPDVYGRFLVEQALLPLSPAITHSFNRSPIKKRIVMLTRRSSLPARGKMLVFVPVILVCLFCFSNNSISQGFRREGNNVIYRGNVFEMSPGELDTITLTDPVTGQQMTKVAKVAPMPLKINGKPIPSQTDQAPVYTGNEHTLRDYLLQNMKDVVSKLDDGEYRLFINNVLIDENGKVVYFTYDNIDNYGSKNPGQGMSKPQHQIPDELQQQIFEKVCKLMENAPGFTPAKLNGVNVAGQYDNYRFYAHFRIKDHKVYDSDGKNEYKEL